MAVLDVAHGFLYHALSGRVLLHRRGTDQHPAPRRWSFCGGRAEPEDGDDPPVTWCREMREEPGAALDPAGVVSPNFGTNDGGMHWHDSYYAWPACDATFVLTTGQGDAWFTIDEGLALPNITEYTPEDLRAFRQRSTLR